MSALKVYLKEYASNTFHQKFEKLPKNIKKF